MSEHQVVPVAADELAQLRADAERYRWLRKHPAWETEAFLSGITPTEYDAAIDDRMDEERMKNGFGEALELTKKAAE